MDGSSLYLHPDFDYDANAAITRHNDGDALSMTVVQACVERSQTIQIKLIHRVVELNYVVAV
jgi:hypothetical protein